ncbi:hypothetical protein GCM10027269_41390 [Kribbella endophytica]
MNGSVSGCREPEAGIGEPTAGSDPAAATAVAPAAVATSNVRRVIGVTGMAELRN